MKMFSQVYERIPGTRPDVSVVMPVLNTRNFLRDSIGSILSQSLHNLELIIVDNGSTDGSREYAESFSDPRIRVLSEPRRGAAFAINAGIGASAAELIAIMDADDISERDRLSIQYAYMRENPDTVLLGARFRFLIGERLVPGAPPLMNHEQIRRALLQGNPVISEGSTMFRASLAKTVGGHRLNGPAHDLDFFLRMSELGRVHNLPDNLYQYRMHAASSTAHTTAIIAEHKMYAVACATARMAGRPEPGFDEFHASWLKRPVLTKLADRARETSGRIYKNALIQRANGQKYRYVLSLVTAALLNPGIAILRMRRQWNNLRQRTGRQSLRYKVEA